MQRHSFLLQADRYTFFRCDSLASLPGGLLQRPGLFVATFDGDVSVMAPGPVTVDDASSADADWRCLRIREAMDFSEVGVAAAVTSTLAGSGISVLVMSGYSHDYFFVKQASLERAVQALEEAGYGVVGFA